MKLIWKSTKILIDKNPIKSTSTSFLLKQQLEEWNWLEKKLSNHFDQGFDSNISEVKEQANSNFPNLKTKYYEKSI
ncbi:MAG: hypothetical protein AB8F94_03825 [Saprospiraceae bacterium]